VWLAGETAGQLTPPPRSIIDGSDVASVVRTCCVRRYGLPRSRLEVSLPVDVATAKRFTLTCRMETFWIRNIAPAVVVAGALLAILLVIEIVRDDEQLLWVGSLLVLILGSTTLAGRLALTLFRSRHHPTLVRGDVHIRGVDGETAQIWASLNPVGAIRIVGG
jgi:hypothetical protein